MVAKLKFNFILKDYKINLFKNKYNLRQKGMTVKEYKKEFYKMNIRTRHRERDEAKIGRYINGLRYEIQYENNMMLVRKEKEAYQYALKAEEKFANK
jgi:hypothetical protein